MAYKSPIEIIQEEARLYYEDAVVKAIQPYLITVNKDELVAALKYDRAQYDNGYVDGRAARDAEIIRCKDCKWYKEGKYFAPVKFCFRLKDSDGEEIGYNFASDDFCSYGERMDEVE